MRAYVGVGRDDLARLRETGVLSAADLVTAVADSEDEEAEADALGAAADLAHRLHGEHLAVAVEVPDAQHGEPLAHDVPLRDVASFAVGEELAWYATQELDRLLG